VRQWTGKNVQAPANNYKMRAEKINEVQKVLGNFTPESLIEKKEILKKMSFENIPSAKQFIQYHDQLIFILSYAQDKELSEVASNEMQRITELVAKRSSLKEKLLAGGIAHTITQSQFSFTLIKWLLQNFPNEVHLHSFNSDGVHPREIFSHILNEQEFELASDEDSKSLKWISKAAGTKNRSKILKWMITALEDLATDELIKEQLFDSMGVFVEVDPRNKIFSRSFGKLAVTRTFYHTEPLLKKFDERELIRRKLPNEKILNQKQKEEIRNASRISLALLHRETDPITYNNENNLKYFELERGLSIALFSIDKVKRLPLESYIGFMMFKNGYPMSYGGAWLFEKRALIGINIFEPFRGGESAYVFAQLLRCYHRGFGAEYFEVEPYQFGKNNPEGIKSGAFWFYHRFGFRPTKKELFDLSEVEFRKIQQEKGYRSDHSTLKKFTGSNLGANFGNSATPINPSKISEFISGRINKDFSSDRNKAKKAAVQKLKKEGVKANANDKLLLFAAFCLDHQKLSKREKTKLSAMIRQKEENEFSYMEALNTFNIRKHLSAEAKNCIENGR
jgi:hypothetical protein